VPVKRRDLLLHEAALGEIALALKGVREAFDALERVLGEVFPPQRLSVIATSLDAKRRRLTLTVVPEPQRINFTLGFTHPEREP
jgi:hypothetical protein